MFNENADISCQSNVAWPLVLVRVARLFSSHHSAYRLVIITQIISDSTNKNGKKRSGHGRFLLVIHLQRMYCLFIDAAYGG